MNDQQMVTVFRNDSSKNVTVILEFKGVGIQLTSPKILTPGDTLSVPKVSADGCVVVLRNV